MFSSYSFPLCSVTHSRHLFVQRFHCFRSFALRKIVKNEFICNKRRIMCLSSAQAQTEALERSTQSKCEFDYTTEHTPMLSGADGAREWEWESEINSGRLHIATFRVCSPHVWWQHVNDTREKASSKSIHSKNSPRRDMRGKWKRKKDLIQYSFLIQFMKFNTNIILVTTAVSRARCYCCLPLHHNTYAFDFDGYIGSSHT